MQSIQVQNKLFAPHTGKLSPLSALIVGKTRLPGSEFHSFTAIHRLWTSQWWGLSNSKVFQGCDAKMQEAVLADCNRTILNEAYFIEKSGLAYTAKMVLLAESTDIAQLYALIGADEARHLAWIEPYIAEEDKTRPYGQFLAFLSQLIEELPPRLLVYLVQIILEGWGLDHYKRLAEGCQYAPLAQIFASILKDEALHHKSGSMLFNPDALLSNEWVQQVREALICYAGMVRVGPFSAVSAIEQVTGNLSVQDVEEVLMALGHPADSHRKLLLLKKLMRQPGVESLIDELELLGCFVPLSPMEAAEFYIASR